MKFSIVTPSLNCEKYVAKTIESVLSQEGNFEIEYIFFDALSTDGTFEIAKSYQAKIANGSYKINCNSATFKCFREKDFGMYDAINKGFTMANGDVFAWINTDDYYEKGAFSKVMEIFTKFPEIKWLKGISDFIGEDEELLVKNKCYVHKQEWIQNGIYGRNAYHITQDSVFWKKELWDKTGGISEHLKFAGDYELWIKMSRIEKLWSINATLSYFRKRKGQLSKQIGRYKADQQEVAPQSIFSNFFIRIFFNFESRFRSIQKIFLILYCIVFQNKPEIYIECTGGIWKKKKSRSYII